MESSYLLLASEHSGYAVRCNTKVNYGVHDEQKQFVKLTTTYAASDIKISANRGAKAAYQLLWKEGYLRRVQRVHFAVDSGNEPNINITGYSSDLAFALAVINKTLGDIFPPLAATGVIGEEGEVQIVSKIPQKVRTALDALPEGGVILLPSTNLVDVTAELIEEAARKKISIQPVNRLDEAAELLGMKVQFSQISCPFKGLETFRFEDSGIFFGRDKEVRDVVQLLKAQGTALVLGGSGSGKSSLVQAGVLAELYKRDAARLNTSYFWTVYHPRERGQHEGWEPSLLSAWANSRIPEEFIEVPTAEQLIRGAKRVALCEQEQLIFVVDQIEELFTQGFNEEAITAFIDYLDRLIAAGIWVVATLRNDFYPAYQESSLSNTFTPDHIYNLAQPDAVCLEQMIELPARMAELEYEVQDRVPLSHRIREDALKAEGVLPLLEYTLTELYSARNKQNKLLTYNAYEKFDGVEGSIGSTAEKIYSGLAPEDQEEVPAIIRKLARWDEQRERYTARPVHLSSLNETQQKIVEAFTDSEVRLLVKDKDKDNEMPIVRLVHEALLIRWQRAKEWLAEDKEFMRWLSKIETYQNEWAEQGNLKDYLLPKGKPVNESIFFLEKRGRDIPNEVAKYLEVSLSLINKKRKLTYFYLTCLFAVFMVFGIYGWILSANLSESKTEVENGLLSQHVLLSELFYEKGDYNLGLKNAILSYPHEKSLNLVYKGVVNNREIIKEGISEEDLDVLRFDEVERKYELLTEVEYYEDFEEWRSVNSEGDYDDFLLGSKNNELFLEYSEIFKDNDFDGECESVAGFIHDIDLDRVVGVYCQPFGKLDYITPYLSPNGKWIITDRLLQEDISIIRVPDLVSGDEYVEGPVWVNTDTKDEIGLGNVMAGCVAFDESENIVAFQGRLGGVHVYAYDYGIKHLFSLPFNFCPINIRDGVLLTKSGGEEYLYYLDKPDDHISIETLNEIVDLEIPESDEDEMNNDGFISLLFYGNVKVVANNSTGGVDLVDSKDDKLIYEYADLYSESYNINAPSIYDYSPEVSKDGKYLMLISNTGDVVVKKIFPYNEDLLEYAIGKHFCLDDIDNDDCRSLKSKLDFSDL